MIECQSAAERIGAWLDDELRGAEADEVRAHIESCPRCAEECRQLQRLQVALEAVFVTEAEKIALQPFWRSVEQKISAKQGRLVGIKEFMHSVLAGPQFVWAIPVVIVALIGALSVDWFTPWRTPGTQSNNFAFIESLDSHGRNVAVFRENESRTTVIWLFQNPEGEDEASSEVTGSSPTF